MYESYKGSHNLKVDYDSYDSDFDSNDSDCDSDSTSLNQS